MSIRSRFISLYVLVVLSMEQALAAGSGEPWDGPLESFLEIVTGTTGTLIATVVVAAAGIGAMVGKFSWMLAGQIIGGIVLVFGSATIAEFFISSVA